MYTFLKEIKKLGPGCLEIKAMLSFIVLAECLISFYRFEEKILSRCFTEG